jgi:hypothetical protein
MIVTVEVINNRALNLLSDMEQLDLINNMNTIKKPCRKAGTFLLLKLKKKIT